MSETSAVSRTEQRMWGAVVSFCLLLGGWWLQNQHETAMRTQQQLEEFVRYVSTTYVQKDYLETINDRLKRMEAKLDALRDDGRDPRNP